VYQTLMRDSDLDALWAAIEAASPLDDADLRRDAPPGVDFDEWFERARTQSDRRRSFIAYYGWSVPDRDAVAAIAGFVRPRGLLEVCAGAGLWSRLLAAEGLDVVATDANGSRPDDHYKVEALEAEAAVLAYPECDALFFSWPPHQSDAAYRALTAFKGDRVVYVGDVRFTGDAQLQNALAAHWTLEDRLYIPAWPALDDYAYLYTHTA